MTGFLINDLLKENNHASIDTQETTSCRQTDDLPYPSIDYTALMNAATVAASLLPYSCIPPINPFNGPLINPFLPNLFYPYTTFPIMEPCLLPRPLTSISAPLPTIEKTPDLVFLETPKGRPYSAQPITDSGANGPMQKMNGEPRMRLRKGLRRLASDPIGETQSSDVTPRRVVEVRPRRLVLDEI